MFLEYTSGLLHAFQKAYISYYGVVTGDSDIIKTTPGEQ
jgi:hypothetical protein